VHSAAPRRRVYRNPSREGDVPYPWCHTPPNAGLRARRRGYSFAPATRASAPPLRPLRARTHWARRDARCKQCVETGRRVGSVCPIPLSTDQSSSPHHRGADSKAPTVFRLASSTPSTALNQRLQLAATCTSPQDTTVLMMVCREAHARCVTPTCRLVGAVSRDRLRTWCRVRWHAIFLVADLADRATEAG
jgi:hypothetical protein